MNHNTLQNALVHLCIQKREHHYFSPLLFVIAFPSAHQIQGSEKGRRKDGG